MNTQEQFNDFQHQLVRRGLPADYAHRAATELADHHQDLVEGLTSSDSDCASVEEEAVRRLGDRGQLIDKVVHEFRRRRWCGRWPLVTFLLGPIALLMVGWILTIALSAIIAWPLSKLGVLVADEPDGIISAGEAAVQRGMQLWYFFLVPSLAMLLLFRWSKQAAMSRNWICLSAVVMAVFVGLFRCDVTSFECSASIDRVFVVTGFPFIESWNAVCQWYSADAWQIAQNLLPLALVTALLARASLMHGNNSFVEESRC